MKMMKRLIPTILILILVSAPVYADDLQDRYNPFDREKDKSISETITLVIEDKPKDGDIIFKEGKNSTDLLKLLAKHGDAKSQYNLGVMYIEGREVGKDYKEAVKWLKLSAEQGYALAQYNLGVIYQDGMGVKQNYTQALNWYRKSAEQGDADAQFNLGVMHEEGHNYQEALKWHRNAAEQGNTGSQSNLGLMYAKGLGVKKDYVEAFKWWSIAEKNGQDVARKNKALAKMLMTPDQIAEAQKLAREWMEEHK